MKYFSELTNKKYDTVEELEKAELAVKQKEEEQKKLSAEKKARADEVEAARNAMNGAIKNYEKVLNAFLRDYKTYHWSETTTDSAPKWLGFFDNFFGIL